MKKKVITVKLIAKEVGGAIVEPACERSKRLCKIACTNVLNSEQLFHIQRLGFEIRVLG